MNTIRKLLEKLKEDHISEYTAECSYYTILSFIPFTILLITLIQYTNINQQTLFEIISRVIPASMNEVILGIIKEVYSKSIGTISISIIFTLWSAGKGLYALIKGLNVVYEVSDKKRNSYIYLKVISLIQTIIFIVVIVIGVILLIFGKNLLSLVQERITELKRFNILYMILTDIMFLSFIFIIFLLIYKFIPRHNNKVTFRSQILGALFGAIALNMISIFFSRYLDIFKGFSITYGSLTVLMLIMIWTYACFYIVFLGAEINQIRKK